MRATDDDRTRWIMPVAVGLSLVFHALLLLLSLWLPLPGQRVAAADLDETVLRFDFAPPGEDTTLQQPPAGTLPDDPQPSQPASSPEPPLPVEPNLVSAPDAPASLQPPSTTAAEPTPVEAAETREAVAEAEGMRGDPAGEPTPENALPRDDAGLVRGGELRRGGESDARRGFDVGEALQDFGRALASRPLPEGDVPSPPGGSPTNVFRPELSELPSSGFGVGTLVFETKEFDWNDYARQIYVAIWRAWHNRLYQTTDEFEKAAHASGTWYLDDWVQVRFTIERSGQVVGIAVESPSGWVPLDLSATVALDEVILPPLPAAFPKPTETVHARFIAIGEIRALRPHLRRLKQAGFF